MKIWILSAAACALLASCEKATERAAAARPGPRSEAASAATRLSDAQKQFLTVEAVHASQAADMLAVPGRVVFGPRSQSAVGATAAGRVTAILVRAGEKVRAGQPLLMIESADAASARAALEQASTRAAAAAALYQRNLMMMEKGVGLESEKQEAEARLKEAQTEQRRAQQTVALLGPGGGGQVTVRAPVGGLVTSVRTTIGAMVAPGGEPLMELGDPSVLQVVALVAESDARRAEPGLEAEVELPALATRVPARVETVSPRVEAESRRTQVYLALGRRPEGLQAGMLAQVALRARGDATIVVPAAAVLIKDGKRRVVYVEQANGSYAAREVQTGRNRDGRVAILSGLADGERIVVRGALLLDTQAEMLL